MSKVKNSVSAASIAAKIGVGLVLIGLLVLVVYFATKCKVDNKPYYECEVYRYDYVVGTKPQAMDLLENVEYCHLYVNKDDTFSLKWKFKDSDDVITETGKYTSKGKEYTFKYDGFPQFGLQNEFHMTLSGKTFTCDEKYESTTGTIYSVAAVFKK